MYEGGLGDALQLTPPGAGHESQTLSEELMHQLPELLDLAFMWL